MVARVFLSRTRQDAMVIEAFEAYDLYQDSQSESQWNRYCSLRNELITNYDCMIEGWVKSIHGRYLQHSVKDMIQVAYLACTEKFSKFEPERGWCLSPFFKVIVYRAVTTHLDCKDRVVSVPSTQTSGTRGQAEHMRNLLNLDEMSNHDDPIAYTWIDPKAADPVDEADLNEMKERLRKALEVVRSVAPLYGILLDRVLAGERLYKIAQSQGVISQTVHCRWRRALRLLQTLMSSRVALEEIETFLPKGSNKARAEAAAKVREMTSVLQ